MTSKSPRSQQEFFRLILLEFQQHLILMNTFFFLKYSSLACIPEYLFWFSFFLSATSSSSSLETHPHLISLELIRPALPFKIYFLALSDLMCIYSFNLPPKKDDSKISTISWDLHFSSRPKCVTAYLTFQVCLKTSPTHTEPMLFTPNWISFLVFHI